MAPNVVQICVAPTLVTFSTLVLARVGKRLQHLRRTSVAECGGTVGTNVVQHTMCHFTQSKGYIALAISGSLEEGGIEMAT